MSSEEYVKCILALNEDDGKTEITIWLPISEVYLGKKIALKEGGFDGWSPGIWTVIKVDSDTSKLLPITDLPWL